MGNIFSAIQDDYDDYVELCKKHGEAPVGIRAEKSFYDHGRDIEKKLNNEATVSDSGDKEGAAQWHSRP